MRIHYYAHESHFFGFYPETSEVMMLCKISHKILTVEITWKAFPDFRTAGRLICEERKVIHASWSDFRVNIKSQLFARTSLYRGFVHSQVKVDSLSVRVEHGALDAICITLGNFCNVVLVYSCPPSFHVFLTTGFDEPLESAAKLQGKMLLVKWYF